MCYVGSEIDREIQSIFERQLCNILYICIYIHFCENLVYIKYKLKDSKIALAKKNKNNGKNTNIGLKKFE